MAYFSPWRISGRQKTSDDRQIRDFFLLRLLIHMDCDEIYSNLRARRLFLCLPDLPNYKNNKVKQVVKNE